MPDVTAAQIAASESAAPPSEPVVETPAAEVPAAADTAETVAETDEQKNARELSEREERSKKAARGVQKRLDELTAEKYAERERANGLQRLLEQTIGQKPAAAQQTATDQEPKRADFTDYEDFVAAKAEYRALKKADALITEKLGTVQQQEQQRFVQAEAQRLRQDFVAKQQEYAKTVPDYWDVVQTEDVRVPPEAAAMLHTMKDAPELIYHMGKNPEVAQKLWNEPPLRQAMILGQLSAALKGPPQVSTAPAPGKPTGARSGEANAPPSDMEGYMRWRAKQRATK